MKKILVIIIVLMLAVGCGADETKSEAKPEIIGVVEEINTIGTAILVDSTGDIVQGLVWVSMRDKPEFAEGVSEMIGVGSYVEIIIDGDIAESYPMQATALKILVNK